MIINLHTKYAKWYNQIIQKAQAEEQHNIRFKESKIYYERHHIIPKCLNGNNNPENLIFLTAREHFLVHWLLTKIYPENISIIYAFHAFNQFSTPSETYQRGGKSWLYKFAREKYVNLLNDNKEWNDKIRLRHKNTIWMRHITTNKQIRIHKDSVDEFILNGYIKGRIIKYRRPHSINTKIKIGKSKKGKPQTEFQKQSVGKHFKQCKWINKNNKTKFVMPYELQQYLNNGWILGRNKK